jgi:hypothetical protein
VTYLISTSLILSELKEPHLEVLFYLIDNGPTSIYDLDRGYPKLTMTKKRVRKRGLPYTRSYIDRIVRKLEKFELVETEKDTSSPRIRKIAKSTFLALVSILVLLKRDKIGLEPSEKRTEKEDLIDLVKMLLEKNNDLSIIHSNWDSFSKIVGEDVLAEKILLTAEDNAYGKYANIESKVFPIKFRAYLDRLIYRIDKPSVNLKEKKRNRRILQFLNSNIELTKSYIAFLAIHDIIKIADGIIDLSDIESLESEKELPNFKNIKVAEGRLFTAEGMDQIFPKYAKIQYVFIGSLMFKLMWETQEPERQSHELKKAPAFSISY